MSQIKARRGADDVDAGMRYLMSGATTSANVKKRHILSVSYPNMKQIYGRIYIEVCALTVNVFLMSHFGERFHVTVLYGGSYSIILSFTAVSILFT